MDDKELLHAEIAKTNELAHALDKKLAVLVYDIKNIKGSLSVIRNNINEIEKKQLDIDYYISNKRKRVNFILNNWRLISALLVTFFAVYEGAKYLLYMKPPGH